MTSLKSRPASRPKLSPLLITLIVMGLLIAAFFAGAGIYTDVLWFQQLDYLRVFATERIGVAALFGLGFVLMFAVAWLTIFIVRKNRPVYASANVSRDSLTTLSKPLQWFVPAILAFFFGNATAGFWQKAMLFINSEPTGKTDPIYNMDLQFFMFQLPFFNGVVGFAQTVILLCLLLTVVFAYVYGGISVVGKELRISKATRVQTAIFAGLYVLSFGCSYWLAQYNKLTDSSGLFTGAGYSDVKAAIPGLQILAVIAILISVMFFGTVFIGRWRLPIIGVAAFLVSSLVLSVGYPWSVQQFKVGPDEKSIEAEYIKHNINATRDAYGVANVEMQRYDAVTTAEAGALRNDAVATANIRIIDPAVIAPTFAQLEQSKQYYKFQESLSIDRYNLDGRIEDTVSAPREIDVSSQKGWYNQSLVYTHGYGLVAAYGNQRSPGGEPVFLENGIPTAGKLGDFEPRIYFGRNSPKYSIVGGEREKPIEVDYPADVESPAAAAITDGEINDKQVLEGEQADTEVTDVAGERQNLTTFKGDGGPVLHGFFEKLLYALKFQDMELLLSDAVVPGSQILYDRDPVQRVAAAAPYLTLDRQPYASVVDGRVVWIIDGYTTSRNYPYSKVSDMGSLLLDADNNNRTGAKYINYIRNSVKATVDAYNGKVTLYRWDETDPVLKAWQKIYPDTLTSASEMSADLLSHVRYPNDMFKVQREILGDYHVTDPGAFYSKEDAWRTPDNPVSRARTVSEVAADGINSAADSVRTPAQPPYYLTLSAGHDKEPTFSIYSTYIPNQTGANTRDILTGYLAADSNASTGENGVINNNYGKLRMLVLPKGSAINGPGQMQNAFNTDPEVSRVLNILEQGETNVVRGNLLTLPVGGGLLYVQPVYVKGSSGRGFPLLQKILTSFGDKIAFENTLDEALDKIFQGNSGAQAGDTTAANSTDKSATVPKTDALATGKQPAGSGDLNVALEQMRTALKSRQEALQKGDWTAYGEADKLLQQAIERALQLQQ
ncbi:UPF0182 family protein [Canibacter sp. lx-45]|nr:UPF0182 family protein [Canibacter zhuwentaonis]